MKPEVTQAGEVANNGETVVLKVPIPDRAKDTATKHGAVGHSLIYAKGLALHALCFFFHSEREKNP